MTSVILSDGTKIENLEVSGNLLYSNSEINFEEMKKKLSPVTIDYGEGYKEQYKYAELGANLTIETTIDEDVVTQYVFSIMPISNDKLAVTQGLEYIAEHLLSDEQALNVPYIFDEWDPNGVEYEKDVSRVQYEGYLWKCIQSHTSQISWNPKDANSLWVRIDDPAEEWPEWRQPEGAHDAYAKGTKVTHNEKHWISDVDNNVWEPGVYGWTESPIEETV